ncbi:stage II sporulation protein M [Heliophilum fasciatum]|uniref:Stage II sporulation protein M n=1 Tax=Heliophilum fasciatum TaxID=35700 RepID=A0A4R2RUV5_9FIRM|nr:stage II sporulation protein M [Heliophilum fasciatum]MCW2277356.1 stage II sporulation protein M [Heliophilum fasciatum]TCP67193.1 stage II sporulation protein M [Heliophilum fasciatum]
MGERVASVMRYHLRSHWGFYLITLLVIAAGIAVGSIGVTLLPAEQAEELRMQLGTALAGLAELDEPRLVWQAVGQNLLSVGLVLFLGLTVIGVPAVLLFLLFRGAVLGFSVGILLMSRPTDGLWMALVALLPSLLLFLPALTVTAVAALIFSLWWIRGRQGQETTISLLKALGLYLGIACILLTVAAFAGFCDAYVTPVLLGRFFTPVVPAVN